MTRRDFISALMAAGASPFLPGCLSPSRSGYSYSAIVLGDVHFDSPDVNMYHARYKPLKGHAAEIFPLRMKRERDMWSGRMQRLAAAARRDVRADTKFTLQLGDLIQGNCGTADVHARMLEDGFAYFKNSVSPDLPFVPIIGNHDIDNSVWHDKKSARAVYRETMLPKLSRELGQKVDDATFVFRQGPDVFLCADFNHPDCKKILRLLDENKDVRYTFIVSHGAIVPIFPGRAFRWFMLGGKKQAEERRALFSALCRRRAIALVGHNHQTNLAILETAEGGMAQFMATSVWSSEKEAGVPFKHKSPAGYAKLPASSKLYDVSDARALFDEYRPHMQKFMLSSAQGRYRLDVSDEAVTMTMYGGDSDRIYASFRLA